MERVTSRLTARYPDIGFILDMFREMRAQGQHLQDTKYYPNTLLLAVLLRLQARQEAPFKDAGEELEEGRGPLLELVAYCWRRLDTAATLLREGLGGAAREEVATGVERSRRRIAESLEMEENLVPRASVSELCGEEDKLMVEDHCPDFVVTIDQTLKAVVLNILGSRGYPGARGPVDFVMDFSLKTDSFMGGDAHAGILRGAKNLEIEALPCLVEQLRRWPGYSLLLAGYSLGAGLAQLLTLSLMHGTAAALLPPGTKVYTLSYGCPPVFHSLSLPCLDNVLDILNHNDAISGISLRGLSTLHCRKRALASLGLHRRTLVRMALGRKGREELAKPGNERTLQLFEEEDEHSPEDKDSPDEVDHGKSIDFLAQATASLLLGSNNVDDTTETQKDNDNPLPDESNPEVTPTLPCKEKVSCGRLLASLRSDRHGLAGAAGCRLVMAPNDVNGPMETENIKDEDKPLLDESTQDTTQKLPCKEKKSSGRLFASLRSEPVTPALWARVEADLQTLAPSQYPKTAKLGGRLMVVKQKKGVRSTRMFRGPTQTSPFSMRIRLKQGMFRDHLPASYNEVFVGLGDQVPVGGLQLLDWNSGPVEDDSVEPVPGPLSS